MIHSPYPGTDRGDRQEQYDHPYGGRRDGLMMDPEERIRPVSFSHSVQEEHDHSVNQRDDRRQPDQVRGSMVLKNNIARGGKHRAQDVLFTFADSFSFVGRTAIAAPGRPVI